MKSRICWNPEEESSTPEGIATRSARVHPDSGRDMGMSPSTTCKAETCHALPHSAVMGTLLSSVIERELRLGGKYSEDIK